jgi:hypothetical protein
MVMVLNRQPTTKKRFETEKEDDVISHVTDDRLPQHETRLELIDDSFVILYMACSGFTINPHHGVLSVNQASH